MGEVGASAKSCFRWQPSLPSPALPWGPRSLTFVDSEPPLPPSPHNQLQPLSFTRIHWLRASPDRDQIL